MMPSPTIAVHVARPTIGLHEFLNAVWRTLKMKPWCHAKNSARRYGGIPDDYLPIHDFFDSSKATIADMRHRALLHSAFGIFVVERVFGTNITNADSATVSVRDIGEDHVTEDIGFIPSVDKWLKNMKIQPWMLGGRRKRVVTRFIPLNGEAIE
jgi:hypothetical protein